MSTAAWIMLLVTWSVVIGLTLRFFVAVLRSPPRDDDESP